jgi:predicted FMN-binding regulatory protein PaiB
MYIPAHFAQCDLAALHEAIERHSFATLVSSAGELAVA